MNALTNAKFGFRPWSLLYRLSQDSLASNGSSVSKSSNGERSFKPLMIPGLTTTETKRFERYTPKFGIIHEQKVEDVGDWTRVWPGENFFSPSLFPIPIRQGHSKNLVENDGLSPGKYANAELLKIPNFLHLTPGHIKKHCEALKKFTTKWPAGLKTDEDIKKHYPIEIVYRTFVNSAPSIRDKRARFVSLKSDGNDHSFPVRVGQLLPDAKVENSELFFNEFGSNVYTWVPLFSLNLDRRGHLKILRLAKSYGFQRRMAQYYSDSDTLELTSGRCPTSRQNYDYLSYVLTVLTMEAKKHEAWEQMETGSYLDFKWPSSRNREAILKMLATGQLSSGNEDSLGKIPSTELPDDLKQKLEAESAVQAYRVALEEMFSTPVDELCGPWRYPKKVPKRRHYHWPEIRDVPFEPVAGADNAVHLQNYATAVRKLWGLP